MDQLKKSCTSGLITNLAEFMEQNNLWDELVKYAEVAVEVGEEINDKQLIMTHKIFGLGWVKAIKLKDINAGISSIQEGKKLAIELNNELEYAVALRNEGHIRRNMGEYDQAELLLLESLDIFRKLGDQRWEVRTLSTLAGVERRRRNWDRAIAYYTEVLKKSEETGNTDQVALNLQRLSFTLWRKGEFEDAQSKAREALTLLERLNVPPDIAVGCLSLARAEYALGRTNEARQQTQRAYEIFSKLKWQHGLNETTELLAAIDRAPSDPSAYLARYGVERE